MKIHQNAWGLRGDDLYRCSFPWGREKSKFRVRMAKTFVLLRGDVPTQVFLSGDCVGRICVGQ